MNVYEVVLNVTVKGTAETKTITRREWAYDAMDAAKQAILNQVAAAGPRGADLELVHVGPPAADIVKAEGSLTAQLTALVAAKLRQR